MQVNKKLGFNRADSQLEQFRFANAQASWSKEKYQVAS